MAITTIAWHFAIDAEYHGNKMGNHNQILEKIDQPWHLNSVWIGWFFSLQYFDAMRIVLSAAGIMALLKIVINGRLQIKL